MTVLFLYTEIAEYFLKSCEELAKENEVHVVRWPVNKEAPFAFELTDAIKIYTKTEFSFEQLTALIEKINPSIIVCSGWVDKDYLKITKRYFKKIPTVLACDTHWKGTLKQQLARILSPFFLLNTFSNGWVPGKAQTDYLKKLGFKTESIKQNFYCCDLQKFNSIYTKKIAQKEIDFPKRFLYVGRYYDFKGITDLWDAFIQLQKEEPNDWELWCLGNGSIPRIDHPKIKHFGFVQPKDLEPILEKTGVFILPSRFEPWGVVVQEYAASGFPLLLSKEVGAGEVFLEDAKNGFSFSPQNINDIKNQLKKAIHLSDKKLIEMAIFSHQLAQKINPKSWTKTVKEIYDGFK